LLLALLTWPVATLTVFAAAPGCQFVAGFKTLHDLQPQVVGDCVQDQSYTVNGDAQQQTTNGLMAWRKQDNWTAFTDGYRTWVNGPSGIQTRLNTERFSWESGSPLTDMESRFFGRLNTDRQNSGLAPVALNQRLVGLAEGRAQDQLNTGGLSHYDSAGNLVFQLLLDSSRIAYASAGENLAENNYDSSRTVEMADSGLMNSPPHRANILNPAFNQAGIGVVGPDTAGRYYYAQIFLQTPS